MYMQRAHIICKCGVPKVVTVFTVYIRRTTSKVIPAVLRRPPVALYIL